MSANDSPSLPERLTDEAHKAFELAQIEARRLRHNRIDTEHLLLGLLRHQDAFAARALTALGVRLEDARQQADALIEDRYKEKHEDRKAQAARRLRQDWRDQAAFTPRSKNVLDLALRQAEISGRYYVGTLHLLRAIFQEPEGVAVRALSDLGIAATDVRRKVMEMLRAGEYQEKKRGGLHNLDRKGRKGTGIRLELLGDDRLARELNELLVLTGVVEIPDENSSPPGLPSGERNEPPEHPLDFELAARIEGAVEQLGMHIEMMRDDLLGLERGHRMLFELIDDREQGGEARGSTDD